MAMLWPPKGNSKWHSIWEIITIKYMVFLSSVMLPLNEQPNLQWPPEWLSEWHTSLSIFSVMKSTFSYIHQRAIRYSGQYRPTFEVRIWVIEHNSAQSPGEVSLGITTVQKTCCTWNHLWLPPVGNVCPAKVGLLTALCSDQECSGCGMLCYAITSTSDCGSSSWSGLWTKEPIDVLCW